MAPLVARRLASPPGSCPRNKSSNPSSSSGSRHLAGPVVERGRRLRELYVPDISTKIRRVRHPRGHLEDNLSGIRSGTAIPRSPSRRARSYGTKSTRPPAEYQNTLLTLLVTVHPACPAMAARVLLVVIGGSPDPRPRSSIHGLGGARVCRRVQGALWTAAPETGAMESCLPEPLPWA